MAMPLQEYRTAIGRLIGDLGRSADWAFVEPQRRGGGGARAAQSLRRRRCSHASGQSRGGGCVCLTPRRRS